MVKVSMSKLYMNIPLELHAEIRVSLAGIHRYTDNVCWYMKQVV